MRFTTTHLFHEFRSAVTNPEKLKKFVLIPCYQLAFNAMLILEKIFSTFEGSTEQIISTYYYLQYDTMQSDSTVKLSTNRQKF